MSVPYSLSPHFSLFSLWVAYPVTYLAADNKTFSWFIIHTDSIHYLWTCWTVCCVTFWSIPSSSCWYYTWSCRKMLTLQQAQMITISISVNCNLFFKSVKCMQMSPGNLIEYLRCLTSSLTGKKCPRWIGTFPCWMWGLHFETNYEAPVAGMQGLALFQLWGWSTQLSSLQRNQSSQVTS